MSVLPLNALATIIAIRLLIDNVARAATGGRQAFIGICAILLLLIVPTSYGAEYGTLALICALFGYFARHRPTVPDMGVDAMGPLTAIMIVMLASFVGMQMITFPFERLQAVLMVGGTFCTTLVLMFFRPAVFPRLSRAVGPAGRWLAHMGGRRTLEIYVLHLVAFKIAMLWHRPDDAALFDWTLYSPYGF
jgi:hypothetical protein